MARGDYFEVTLRTLTGVEKVKIAATSIGASVALDMPKRDEMWIEVTELNKAHDVVRLAQFNRNDVIAVLQGHNAPMTRTKPSSRRKPGSDHE